MKEIYKNIMVAAGVDEKMIAEAMAKRRQVPLFGEINSDIATGITRALVALDLKEKAPITLLIDSPGGNVEEGKKIISAIQCLISPVNGLVIDFCGSMAVDVLFHCQERLSVPQAKFFLHNATRKLKIREDHVEITGKEIMEILQHFAEDTKAQDEVYAKRMGISMAEACELCRRGDKYDLRYTAEQALQKKIIDRIVTDFKFWR